MEAAMIGTFLVSVAALIIAVLGCAWVKPIEARESHHDTVSGDWIRDKEPSDRMVTTQEP
jgi:hypothetical protein